MRLVPRPFICKLNYCIGNARCVYFCVHSLVWTGFVLCSHCRCSSLQFVLEIKYRTGKFIVYVHEMANSRWVCRMFIWEAVDALLVLTSICPKMYCPGETFNWELRNLVIYVMYLHTYFRLWTLSHTFTYHRCWMQRKCIGNYHTFYYFKGMSIMEVLRTVPILSWGFASLLVFFNTMYVFVSYSSRVTTCSFSSCQG